MASKKKTVEYRLTNHAKEEMCRRQIGEVSDEQDRQVLESRTMKVTYDRETDTLTVVFSDMAIVESDEDKPGVILDYDASGNLVSLEILDASHRVKLPTQIEYQVAPSPT